jgi:pimeloyl-ACP methyl ester carboxylesterase
MPLLLFAFIIVDLLSVAYPFIAYWLYKQWDQYHDTPNDDYAQRCLIGAIAVSVFILLGKFLIKFLLSKRRAEEDEPYLFKSDRTEKLERPDGTVINIEYSGKEKGPSIIFIHGMNASLKNWYYQRSYFQKNYRLIMMDLPGMGKSLRPKNKNYSLEKLADDLQAVIDHTKPESPVLWGHSLGGMTILSYLKKNDQRNAIKGVILQHTTYTNPVKTILFRNLLTVIQRPILTPLCYIIIALSPIIWISRWMSYLNGTSHIISRLLTFAGTQTAKQLDFTTLLSTLTPPAVMARGCLAMFRYDASETLAHIKIPVLVVGADKDRLTQPDASMYMNHHIPNAKLLMLRPGNHQALIERHKEVNKGVENFIKNEITKNSDLRREQYS